MVAIRPDGPWGGFRGGGTNCVLLFGAREAAEPRSGGSWRALTPDPEDRSLASRARYDVSRPVLARSRLLNKVSELSDCSAAEHVARMGDAKTNPSQS